MELLERLAVDPRLHDLLSVVKGARNGLVYGAKIRFPHALVMTFLFKRGSLQSKLRAILLATKDHALKLALFATIYKTLVIVQRRLFNLKRENMALAVFIAGFIGGGVVFRDSTSINQQIVLYLFSRTITALGTDIWTAAALPTPKRPFTLFSALCWGAVMTIYYKGSSNLQLGLKNSMTYIYSDSDNWSNLYTLLWHNK
ncbi:hypothetical protein BB561_004901 [Smittium simulii]|uniref:Peroxisomal membrane protein 4 n=1 Tax=Smittium simulii TaxID=133385 RepID=A0A2T9YDJ5_9FUNG|nr:hypothetical protein BB561_004901 [Smittium simulii]